MNFTNRSEKTQRNDCEENEYTRIIRITALNLYKSNSHAKIKNEKTFNLLSPMQKNIYKKHAREILNGRDEK